MVPRNGKCQEPLFRHVFFGFFRSSRVREEHFVHHEFADFRIRLEERIEPWAGFVPGEGYPAVSGPEYFGSFRFQGRVEIERVHDAGNFPFQACDFFLEGGDFGISEQFRLEKIRSERVCQERDDRFRKGVFSRCRPIIGYRRTVREHLVQPSVRHGSPDARHRRNTRHRVLSRERAGVEIVPPKSVENVCREREVEEDDFFFKHPDAHHGERQLENEARRPENAGGRQNSF